MYIITSKENNMILNFGNTLDYMSNGYPRLTEEDIYFPTEFVNVHQNVEVSDEVKANPSKYCYIESEGFYLNPDYVEPDPTNTYGISDELFNQIKSDYREKIAQEVSENGYNA